MKGVIKIVKEQSYILISNFILEQLKEDRRFRNVHYVARYEFLKNQRDDKYVNRILKKCNKSFDEVKKDSQIFIRDIRRLVIKELKRLDYLKCMNLLNDTSELDKFLTHINETIEREYNNDFFLR